jgi:hypothetical protein
MLKGNVELQASITDHEFFKHPLGRGIGGSILKDTRDFLSAHPCTIPHRYIDKLSPIIPA